MTACDGLQDMTRPLLLGELASRPLALDEDTADRLLAGRLSLGDAPSGCVDVARALATAAAPTTPREPGGRVAAVVARGASTRASTGRRKAEDPAPWAPAANSEDPPGF